MPTGGEGEAIDLVELMAKQASEHPPGTPHYLEARLELLHVLCLSDLLDAAMELLDEILAGEVPKERRCGALMIVGGCAERSKRFDVAVRMYRRAIEVDPEEPGWRYFARNNLAYSLNQLGKFEDASTIVREAIEIDPEQFNAHKNLAVAMEGLGLFEQAADEYLRSTYLEPFDRRAYEGLVDLVKKHPELLEKLDHLRSEIEFCRDPIRVAMAGRN